MPTRYWTGTINGIPLEESAGNPAGFDVAGAEAFESAYTGNIVAAADGYPHTQTVVLQAYGKVLEIKFLHIPGTLLRTLLTSLTATLPGGGSFACTFADGFQTITGQFKPALPDWYKRGEVDGNYIKDAVLRLISTGG